MSKLNISDNIDLDTQTIICILTQNIQDLQHQLAEAYKRINELQEEKNDQSSRNTF
jgi:hypothetical protein